MKLSILGLLISSTLCGCSLFGTDESNNIQQQRENYSLFSDSDDSKIVQNTSITAMEDPLQASVNFKNSYNYNSTSTRSDPNLYLRNDLNPKNHNINHYVRGIMQDLVSNLQHVNSSTTVVVTSFVFLDSNLSTENLLGNQIAESFIHEVHNIGIPVIDFKTSDYVSVTASGDFVLSRNFLELKSEMTADYVLLGTLTKQQGGVLVNARVVGMKTKAVVATAQGFLPPEIANSLLNNKLNDKIKLIGD
jgi:TolB-like protein